MPSGSGTRSRARAASKTTSRSARVTTRPRDWRSSPDTTGALRPGSSKQTGTAAAVDHYARGGEQTCLDEGAALGYSVRLRDIVPLHIEQAVSSAGVSDPALDGAVGDARDLDLADESAGAVLLLGPLYHLPEGADRARSLAEARRVPRPGGVLFAAAISRWSRAWPPRS
jgi:SAM-dependent methyltransferase